MSSAELARKALITQRTMRPSTDTFAISKVRIGKGLVQESCLDQQTCPHSEVDLELVTTLLDALRTSSMKRTVTVTGKSPVRGDGRICTPDYPGVDPSDMIHSPHSPRKRATIQDFSTITF